MMPADQRSLASWRIFALDNDPPSPPLNADDINDASLKSLATSARLGYIRGHYLEPLHMHERTNVRGEGFINYRRVV